MYCLKKSIDSYCYIYFSWLISSSQRGLLMGLPHMQTRHDWAVSAGRRMMMCEYSATKPRKVAN